jgi:5-formyltetrahydrofolate cyclo-ligase
MLKVDLRKSLIQQRQSLALGEWQSKSQQICDRIDQLPIFQRSQTVLSYLSLKQEPDLRSLFGVDKTWGVPRCVDRALAWHVYDEQQMQAGAYGILEPAPDLPTLAVDQVELILVPCVGCDRRGYRLGYGGGFYDRLLSDPAWATIPAIGIVFEFALLAELPTDPWDLQLTGICTEQGYRSC